MHTFDSKSRALNIRASTLAIATSLAACSLAAVPGTAHAQFAPVAPVRENIDANGVDLFTGKLAVTAPALTLGSESSSLTYYRWNKGAGWSDNVMAFLNQSGSVMTVSLGGVSDSFNMSGSTFTSTEGNGSTLTYNGTSKIYTYTAADGTVVRFDENAINTYVAYSNKGMALDITRPDGEKLTFGYGNITYCHVPGASGTFCAQTGKAYRVTSVTSSFGYKLAPSYDPSFEWVYNQFEPYEQPDFAAYGTVLGVQALNLAVSSSTVLASQSFGSTTSGADTYYNVTDAESRQTKYRMGTAGEVIGITLPGHSSEDVTVGYAAGLVTSVARAGAGTTSYARSDSGNVRTVTVTPPTGVTPALSSTVYTFDIPSQRMTSMTVNDGAANRTTEFHYEPSGSRRLIKIVYPEGNYVELTRDARGNVTHTKAVGKPGSNVADIVTRAFYSDDCATKPKTCNQPDWTKTAKGNPTDDNDTAYRTDYTYDDGHGGLLTVTAPADANGVRPKTTYGYAGFQAYYYQGGSIVASGQTVHRLVSIASCRTAASCAGGTDERKVTIGYGPQQTGTGNNLLPVSTTIARGDGSLAATTTLAYDGAGNLVSVDGPETGTADSAVAYYNAARQPTGSIGPDPDGAGAALYPAVQYTYRSDGQLEYVHSGTVTAQSNTFTGWSRTNVQAFGYDSYHRKVREVLYDGGPTTAYHVNDVVYDAAGRVQCSIQYMNQSTFGYLPLPTSCAPYQTGGPQGPDRVVQNHYDALDRVVKVTTGVGSGAPIDDQIATFTANGRLLTLTDAEGNRTTYEYDGHDRLAKTRFPSPTTDGVSSTTDFEQLGYDANGNVTSFRTRRNETLTMTYDNLDRLVTKVIPDRAGLDATHERDVFFGWDLHGNMTYARFDSASGEGIVNAFNALGRLESTTNTMDGASRTLSYQYDLSGNRTRLTWPDNHYVHYERHPSSGQLAWASLDSTAASGGAGLFRRTLDSAGRLSMLATLNTTTDDWGSSSAYAWDAVTRLSSFWTTFMNPVTLTYNPASQIAQRSGGDNAYAWTHAVNGTTAYTANGLNQYTAITDAPTLTHDANGNLAQVTSATWPAENWTYDAENRLVGRATGTFTASARYDPLGRLHEVTSNAGWSVPRRLVYDGDALVAEYHATSSALLRRFVHGSSAGDDPLVWFEGATVADSARRYFYADERGSIVAVTDGAGGVTATVRYDEYGKPNSTASPRFMYTGQAYHAELGSYYYKARLYNPHLGRFLQTDPIGYGDGMNLYAYVGNDPVNGVDPTGLRQCPNGDGASDCDIPDLSDPEELRRRGIIVVEHDRPTLPTRSVNSFAIVRTGPDYAGTAAGSMFGGGGLVFQDQIAEHNKRPQGGRAGAVRQALRWAIMKTFPKLRFPTNSRGIKPAEFGRLAGLRQNDTWRSVTRTELREGVERLQNSGITRDEVIDVSNFYTNQAFRDIGNEAAAFRSWYLRELARHFP